MICMTVPGAIASESMTSGSIPGESGFAGSRSRASWLLTGGTGSLGRALCRLVPEMVAPGRAELDVTDPGTISAAFLRHRPTTVIHAAALVGTRPCEERPGQCLAVNVVGTVNMVEACRRHACRLVYISTDYVFDGRRGGYREDDPVSPINHYARSKVAGEYAALTLPGALILRFRFVEDDRWKFPAAPADQFTSGDRLGIIAPDVVAAAASSITGILHLGTGRKSVFSLARSIDPDIESYSIAECGLNIPVDTSLDCSLWQKYRAGEVPRETEEIR